MILFSCAPFGLENAFDEPIPMGLSLIKFYLINNLKKKNREEEDLAIWVDDLVPISTFSYIFET